MGRRAVQIKLHEYNIAAAYHSNVGPKPKAPPMPMYHNCVFAIVLLVCVTGCGDSEMADNSNNASPAIQDPESANDEPMESTLLRQEMIDATVELMQAQRRDADPKELQSQVEEMLDAEMMKIRKHYPEFLIVSAETEERLRAGTPIQNSADRIADAEKAIGGLQTPGLVQVLLPQHKAGTLTPIRTELLAQLMVGVEKSLEYSLTH